ncbi:MAG: UDP-N-acetylglucosamine 1-carboxyvinyltransferase, partial [bacterium]|nr:UDP-N-acetylglucosamine 1-carboxyvinyltransferase [bacterium]
MSRNVDYTKQIGNFIAELREKRGITQKDLAKSLKTSQSAVARMEKGKQNFSTEMLSKISAVLNQEIITLGSGAINFQIEGGHKLSGKIKTRTAKNSAVALLCASLLNKAKTTLKDMPQIEEVFRIIEVLESVGAKVVWDGKDIEVTPPKKLKIANLNTDAAIKTRSAIMLIGPLVHLLKTFKLPHPGGCKLGKRSIRAHLFALENLGVKIKTTEDSYLITSQTLKPSAIVMYESSETGTENVLMAAAKIKGKTVIKLAPAGYQVEDLCRFLEKLGVKIEGIGTTTLTLYGKKEINTPVTFRPSEDPIESMLFLSIAATTGSALTVEACPIDFLELELLKLEKMGFKYKILKRYRSKNGFTNLADIETIPSNLTALEEKIYARPMPGLNPDNLPFFVPIATQAKGTTLIHDWIYENRAIYYMELSKLGANIILADPHRVYIEGPTELQPAEIICPPALRPAAIILIGMLAAKGTSILRNVYSINRGYEDLVNRLNKLGAKIK